MFTLLIFIIILSVLIIAHEFGHFYAAKRVGVRVEKFSLGFGPQLFRKKKGDTEYSISAIPLGGFVKLAGDNLEEYKGKQDEYFYKTPGERCQIIFAGPFLNYVLGFLVFWLIFVSGYPTLTAKVGSVLDGYGAKEAGIEAGDKIMSVDGVNVDYWEDVQRQVANRQAADKVKLIIKRNEQVMSLEVKIKEKEVSDQLGSKRSIGLIGITPYDEIVRVRHGLFSSLILSTKQVWNITLSTYKGLWFLITGKISVRDSVTGPLGIFLITSKAANMGLVALLHLVAVLNISLGLFNLLPLPVLDGGHIILLGIEKIRKRALSLKAEEIITKIGLSLIITLVVFVTYNDILRIFGDKFNKFIK
ncbi:MAG: RIP metalloprotease RseP [Candidatus Omnitrophota bacterium]|jgi:regulator of sigma E protease